MPINMAEADKQNKTKQKMNLKLTEEIIHTYEQSVYIFTKLSSMPYACWGPKVIDKERIILFQSETTHQM